MALSIRCSECSKRIQYEQKHAGRVAACPGCGAKLRLPKAPPEKESRPAAGPSAEKTTENAPRKTRKAKPKPAPEDEFDVYAEDDQLFDDYSGDDEFGGDGYDSYSAGNQLPPRRAKTTKKRATSTNSKSKPESKTNKMPLIIGGCVAGGLLLVTIIVVVVMSVGGSDSDADAVADNSAVDTAGSTDSSDAASPDSADASGFGGDGGAAAAMNAAAGMQDPGGMGGFSPDMAAVSGPPPEDMTPGSAQPGSAQPGRMPPGGQPPVARRPPTLPDHQQQITVALPGRVDDVIMADGENYLVMKLTQNREVRVFDLNTAKFTHTIRLQDDAAEISASRKMIFVVSSKELKIEQWSLDYGQKESNNGYSFIQALKSPVCGADSNGPLLIQLAAPRNRGLFVWQGIDLENDLFIMDDIELKLADGQQMSEGFLNAPQQVRASMNGQTICVWDNHSHDPLQIMRIEPGKLSATVYEGPTQIAYAHPNANGSLIYTNTAIYDVNMQVVGKTIDGIPVGNDGFYIAREAMDSDLWNLYRVGNSEVVSRMPEFRMPRLTQARGDHMRMWGDRRIFVFPNRKIICTFPDEGKNEMVIHGVDIQQLISQPVIADAN